MKTFTFAEHVKRTVIRPRHTFKAMWRVCRPGRFLVLKPWREPSSGIPRCRISPPTSDQRALWETRKSRKAALKDSKNFVIFPRETALTRRRWMAGDVWT